MKMKPFQMMARILAVLLFCCSLPADHPAGLIDPAGMTVESRIKTPPGFLRVQAASGSFADFLRQLPLKPHGAKVRLYDGGIKENNGIYDAVVNLKIGHKKPSPMRRCRDPAAGGIPLWAKEIR